MAACAAEKKGCSRANDASNRGNKQEGPGGFGGCHRVERVLGAGRGGEVGGHWSLDSAEHSLHCGWSANGRLAEGRVQQPHPSRHAKKHREKLLLLLLSQDLSHLYGYVQLPSIPRPRLSFACHSLSLSLGRFSSCTSVPEIHVQAGIRHGKTTDEAPFSLFGAVRPPHFPGTQLLRRRVDLRSSD